MAVQVERSWNTEASMEEVLRAVEVFQLVGFEVEWWVPLSSQITTITVRGTDEQFAQLDSVMADV